MNTDQIDYCKARIDKMTLPEMQRLLKITPKTAPLIAHKIINQYFLDRMKKLSGEKRD